MIHGELEHGTHEVGCMHHTPCLPFHQEREHLVGYCFHAYSARPGPPGRRHLLPQAVPVYLYQFPDRRWLTQHYYSLGTRSGDEYRMLFDVPLGPVLLPAGFENRRGFGTARTGEPRA